MGRTIINMRVHGPVDSADVEALADTGSTFTKVPRSVIEKIGVEPAYESKIELGDSRTITRRLALADVEIDGVRRPVLVSIAEDGEFPLVGYTTLETLGFKVNPVTHALESKPAIEYRVESPY